MKITAVVYGKTTLPESMIFDGGDAAAHRRIALRSFLVETEERLILVDAGCVTMPGYEVDSHIGTLRALSELGIAPTDITDLILTHHHHDHVECASSFHNARVYIQRDELPLAKGYLDGCKNITTFDEELVVCEGVRVIRIGGHSIGSCIVSVTCEGTEYVISGDECYHPDCLKKRIPTGCAYSKERSRAFIEEYSKEKYKVLVMHAEEMRDL